MSTKGVCEPDKPGLITLSSCWERFFFYCYMDPCYINIPDLTLFPLAFLAFIYDHLAFRSLSQIRNLRTGHHWHLCSPVMLYWASS